MMIIIVSMERTFGPLFYFSQISWLSAHITSFNTFLE